uniref:Putative secreted protein n=1 Tax=Anopheles marajoara TaxID=58244 RepID=A0A2M4C5S9_9DIPT
MPLRKPFSFLELALLSILRTFSCPDLTDRPVPLASTTEGNPAVLTPTAFGPLLLRFIVLSAVRLVAPVAGTLRSAATLPFAFLPSPRFSPFERFFEDTGFGPEPLLADDLLPLDPTPFPPPPNPAPAAIAPPAPLFAVVFADKAAEELLLPVFTVNPAVPPPGAPPVEFGFLLSTSEYDIRIGFTSATMRCFLFTF